MYLDLINSVQTIDFPYRTNLKKKNLGSLSHSIDGDRLSLKMKNKALKILVWNQYYNFRVRSKISKPYPRNKFVNKTSITMLLLKF